MTRLSFLFVGLLWVCMGLLAPAQAHEVRPGYIEITETAPDTYQVIWKQPVRDTSRFEVAGLGLRPVFPEVCSRAGDSHMQRRPGVLIERFQTSLGNIEFCPRIEKIFAVHGWISTILV